MARVFINRPVSAAMIQAMIQTELANNNPGTQVPNYSVAPINPVLGFEYYNTTLNKKFMYKSTGWEEVDTKDNTIEDVFGVTLMQE